ncbi:MAG: hypothetical protein B7Y51_03435 [Burkholderiales bacterium 28-67-8]|nr:MAG: hypothetical protein B7Y51_03435 [Burkholderiales bacterium 28-67-8]
MSAGNVRYTETKERSAELLRQVIGHMGKHAAAFNPVTFTVWYEYSAGVNAKLAAAIDALAAQSLPIDDKAIGVLYQAHVASADAKAVELIGGEMQQLMKSIAQSASQAGDQAGEFGAQLNGLTAALVSKDEEQLASSLSEVLAGALEMRASTDVLQRKVAEGQSEIDRLRHALEHARGEALLDPLTGVLNRKGFDQKLDELLSQPTGADGEHYLVMLDIDHFKKVNDTHGHLVGDRVIQALGEIMRTSVTNPQHAIARYGGEEFAILAPQTSLEQSIQVAETIRRRTKAMKFRHRNTKELNLSVSVSVGIARMRPGDDAMSLISRSDSALYRSKAEGRDRLTCAD